MATMQHHLLLPDAPLAWAPRPSPAAAVSGPTLLPGPPGGADGRAAIRRASQKLRKLCEEAHRCDEKPPAPPAAGPLPKADSAVGGTWSVELSIVNAMHLPTVRGGRPSTFVSYSWQADGAEPWVPGLGEELGRTEVIYFATCPAWDYAAELRLPRADYPRGFQGLQLALELWHVHSRGPDSGRRLLLGSTVVPLRQLAREGELEGGFHVRPAHSEDVHGQGAAPARLWLRLRARPPEAERAWMAEAEKPEEGEELEPAPEDSLDFCVVSAAADDATLEASPCGSVASWPGKEAAGGAWHLCRSPGACEEAAFVMEGPLPGLEGWQSSRIVADLEELQQRLLARFSGAPAKPPQPEPEAALASRPEAGPGMEVGPLAGSLEAARGPLANGLEELQRQLLARFPAQPLEVPAASRTASSQGQASQGAVTPDSLEVMPQPATPRTSTAGPLPGKACSVGDVSPTVPSSPEARAGAGPLPANHAPLALEAAPPGRIEDDCVLQSWDSCLSVMPPKILESCDSSLSLTAPQQPMGWASVCAEVACQTEPCPSSPRYKPAVPCRDAACQTEPGYDDTWSLRKSPQRACSAVSTDATCQTDAGTSPAVRWGPLPADGTCNSPASEPLQRTPASPGRWGSPSSVQSLGASTLTALAEWELGLPAVPRRPPGKWGSSLDVETLRIARIMRGRAAGCSEGSGSE